LAPAAGPAIPDPDPLAITPLMPTVENTPPTAAISNAAMEGMIKDLPPVPGAPAALTPVPTGRSTPMLSSDVPAYSMPGEPAASLSKESKALLSKLPSNIDGKKSPSNIVLDIDRSKDTKYISAEKPEDTVTHEAMGMKLQVKNSPLNFDYELEKAYNAIVAGHTEVAIEIYERILANDANHKAALFGLASSYHRAGQLDRARPLYAKLLSIDPGNRDAMNNFLVLLADEAPNEALSQLAILEDKNPGFSTIPAQMAVIYQKLGDTDRASDKMFRAVSLAPENLAYRYNLAILLDKQNKYEEAGKLYRQLIEAGRRGEVIPGDMRKIQERLTFISSNRP